MSELHGKKISVVITHYDRLFLLIRAVDSALAQGPLVGEIIVVDDCSPTLTEADILSALPKSTLLRVLKLERNAGSQNARSVGVRASRFGIIALLDSDDEWLPTKLFYQVEYMRRGSYDLCATAFYKCFGSEDLVCERSIPYRGSGTEYLLKQGGHLQTSTMLMTRELAESIGFPKEVRKFQDWDFLIRSELSGFRIGYLSDRLSVYHFGHGGQMTGCPDSKAVREFLSRLAHELHPRIYFFALSRTLARTEIESGRITDGFRTYFSACVAHRFFDPIGLLKLVRKSLIALNGNVRRRTRQFISLRKNPQ
ncbi:glycosyltransferase family 2 protein [Stenotrophomonas sp. YIM B06876]|uniref:glycosyltransferase family 2 protein n=1 Tax=Stenotrophomonas sp. YIM B06876 TaxID=3060211 RepID=UPI002738CDBC|nr:glycosyltransferase family 2 protein [Stenotrophomonas sp. YIM B06876]